MAFCSNCGAETGGGAFCAKCGAPVAAAPGGQPQYQQQVPPGGYQQPGEPAGYQQQGPPGGYQQPYAPPPAASAGLQENVAGALCYVLGLVTGILFLVLQPYNQNPRIRFHAFQAIFFHVAWIIFWYGLHIILSAMGYSLLGALFALLSALIGLVLGLGGFALWLFLMWRAYNNNPLVLPIVGPLAQAQANKV